MASEDTWKSAFESYTVPEICAVIARTCPVSSTTRKSRDRLSRFCASRPEHVQAAILADAQSSTGSKRKRAIDERDDEVRKRTRTFSVQLPPSPSNRNVNNAYTAEREDVDTAVKHLLDSDFLTVPPPTEVEECIARVIDRTSNSALEQVVCFVCARRIFRSESTPSTPQDVAEPSLLSPAESHPTQTVVNGCIFHGPALSQPETFICLQCKAALDRGETPAHSLANNMWIGEVPFELRILTLPERLLVSLNFPAAYIVKLYTKEGSPATTNAALRGNVSTYRLHAPAVAGMLTGNLLPQPVSLLASLIAVTFVGKQLRPLYGLKRILQVRRQRVLDALRWLKSNNPLYAAYEIDEARTHDMPEDDVPDEISMNVRYSDDTDAVEREHSGYVPESMSAVADPEDGEDLEGQELDLAELQPDFPTDDAGDTTQASDPIIPIRANGVVDVGADAVTDLDLFGHGAENLVPAFAPPEEQEWYRVRRGDTFVNEYARLDKNGERFDGGPGNPNLLLGAFPTLFPYGRGGIEVQRNRKVTFEAHVRWALQYDDRRFRKDLHFVFLVFGVYQKRQVCRASVLQIKRSSWNQNRSAFESITVNDLLDASQEEQRRVPFSNAAVRSLRKQITTVRAKVVGTDESRISIRSQIWAMTLQFNPPSLWATLNLSDTGDPIAQVLAGEQIDLDAVHSNVWSKQRATPSKRRRGPMFGISKSGSGVIRRKQGIVGMVNGYIGTVEAQGRGTLHLHILFWLKGAPVASVMKHALAQEDFQDRLKKFIKANIRADLVGMTGEEQRRATAAHNIAYCRPEDPRLPDYQRRRDESERRTAIAAQRHVCRLNSCLRRDDWVLPNGECGPKRTYGFMNGWNPAIQQVTHCNQDMKFISNGADTKDITFYITLYIAKRQIQAANASALLATAFQFAKEREERARQSSSLGQRDANSREANDHLLVQCANTLNRQQELSAPEVISYLMGWGDRYISHNFVPLFWNEVTATLRKQFPGIALPSNGVETPGTSERSSTDEEPLVRVENNAGGIVLKDQLKDYRERGPELEEYNLYRFLTDTYDGPQLNADTANSAQHQGPGRPPSTRIPYLPEAERTSCRIMRSDKTETVVQIIGQWFPRSTDTRQEYYAAQMLTLLRPWRDLGDLKPDQATFSATFADFMSEAPQKIHDIVENIQYYYDASDRSAQRNENDGNHADQHEMGVDDGPDYSGQINEAPASQADVDEARRTRYPRREEEYGEGAMRVADALHIFSTSTPPVPTTPDAPIASPEDENNFRQWADRVTAYSRTAEFLVHNVEDVGASGLGGDVSNARSSVAQARPTVTKKLFDEARGTRT
ncbi:ATP-dependent DNA helicase [Mycena kentingensis (nom. inval.)]|nr:ATP-dependent DNA helicase [Mycena kentingensis (nom. inval.)]